jgi:predicted secreted acid phosphatase
MKIHKIFLSFSLFASLSIPVLAFAQEPVNLATVKQQLIEYHDNGQYEKDIKRIDQQAIAYLNQRLSKANFQGKKPAIVFDIDETALSNYHDMVRLNFGGTLKDILKEEDKGSDPVIRPTLELYQFAKSHNVAVFFVTGRFEYQRKPTEDNLREAGYTDWEGLSLREGKFTHAPAATYKTAVRKQLTEQGYDIVLNIGDQDSDLRGGYAEKTFKLPNPYYYIP